MNDGNTSLKTIFIVLGIARSGTSVIAKAINALGVDLGHRLNPSNKWNPKGFWEDLDVVYEINQKIFQKLNYKQGIFREFQLSELEDHLLDDTRFAATQILVSRFNDSSSWGFKDPNTVRILPFWQRIFAENNLQEKYIIALRNPLESANSYQSKTFKFNQEKTLIMWLLHLLPAIAQTQGKNRVIVHYDLILKHPLQQLERIKMQLSMDEKSNKLDIQSFINEFLDQNLRHSEYSFEDLEKHPASQVAPLCLKAYKLLLQLAKDEIKDDENFYLAWQSLMIEFKKSLSYLFFS